MFWDHPVSFFEQSDAASYFFRLSGCPSGELARAKLVDNEALDVRAQGLLFLWEGWWDPVDPLYRGRFTFCRCNLPRFLCFVIPRAHIYSCVVGAEVTTILQLRKLRLGGGGTYVALGSMLNWRESPAQDQVCWLQNLLSSLQPRLCHRVNSWSGARSIKPDRCRKECETWIKDIGSQIYSCREVLSWLWVLWAKESHLIDFSR